MSRYAAKGAAAIIRADEEADAHTVLVGGHALLINAIVLHLFGVDNDALLDIKLAELQGFRVGISSDGGVAEFQLIQ